MFACKGKIKKNKKKHIYIYICPQVPSHARTQTVPIPEAREATRAMTLCEQCKRLRFLQSYADPQAWYVCEGKACPRTGDNSILVAAFRSTLRQLSYRTIPVAKERGSKLANASTIGKRLFKQKTSNRRMKKQLQGRGGT